MNILRCLSIIILIGDSNIYRSFKDDVSGDVFPCRSWSTKAKNHTNEWTQPTPIMQKKDFIKYLNYGRMQNGMKNPITCYNHIWFCYNCCEWQVSSTYRNAFKNDNREIVVWVYRALFGHCVLVLAPLEFWKAECIKQFLEMRAM